MTSLASFGHGETISHVSSGASSEASAVLGITFAPTKWLAQSTNCEGLYSGSRLVAQIYTSGSNLLEYA